MPIGCGRRASRVRRESSAKCLPAAAKALANVNVALPNRLNFAVPVYNANPA